MNISNPLSFFIELDHSPKLHLFGSSANHFCLLNHDVDLCLTIDQSVGEKTDIIQKFAEVLAQCTFSLPFSLSFFLPFPLFSLLLIPLSNLFFFHSFPSRSISPFCSDCIFHLLNSTNI